MKRNQREILLDLYYKKNDVFIQENNPFDILIHSVLNTIKFENLIKIYIYNELQELNSSIFSNLSKRIQSESNIERIYEYLKIIIETENNNYHFSQRIRIALELLLENLPNDYKNDFFNTYFYSNYLNDKKSSIKYLDYSNKIVNSDLLHLYTKTQNTLFLKPILKKKNKKFIENNFFKIWNEDLSFYSKIKIVEMLNPLKSKIELFIKEEEPDIYFQLLLINNKVTTQDFIEKIESTNEENRTWYIWNASKHLKFEMLEKAIRQYIS